MFEASDTPYRDVALYAGVGALVVSLLPLALFRMRPGIGFIALLVTFTGAMLAGTWVTRTHDVQLSGLGESSPSSDGGGSTAGVSIVEVSHGLTSDAQSRLRILLLSGGVMLWSLAGFVAVASAF